MNGATADVAGSQRFPLPLACPRCRVALPETEEELRCPHCGHAWPRRGTITCFARGEEYWGEISRDEMQQVLGAAETMGWREGLQHSLAERHREISWYAASETRADFRFLLPLGPQSVVLDVGAGWGTLTIPLARVARWVVAMDVIYERARFQEIRASQERLNNIQIVQAEVERPPFLPETFDVVVANGVLEWVAVNRPDLRPREAQIAFLRCMRELLRPGGVLYVGIENRFGLGQWRGDVDHSGLRYTSLLPRSVADRYTRLRRAWGGGRRYRAHDPLPGYRTYTYSLWGYQRLLGEAGFTRVKAYTSIQGYNDPDRVVPLDSDTALRFYYQHLTRPRSAFLRACRRGGELWWRTELRLRRLLAQSILLIAERGGEREGGEA